MHLMMKSVGLKSNNRFLYVTELLSQIIGCLFCKRFDSER
jgi:hypothetical protein